MKRNLKKKNAFSFLMDSFGGKSNCPLTVCVCVGVDLNVDSFKLDCI